jgi:hypothetical protein
LVGKPEGNRPFVTPRRRWGDNIRMVLKEVGWEGVDWMEVDRNRENWRVLINTIINFRVS